MFKLQAFFRFFETISESKNATFCMVFGLHQACQVGCISVSKEKDNRSSKAIVKKNQLKGVIQ